MTRRLEVLQQGARGSESSGKWQDSKRQCDKWQGVKIASYDWQGGKMAGAIGKQHGKKRQAPSKETSIKRQVVKRQGACGKRQGYKWQGGNKLQAIRRPVEIGQRQGGKRQGGKQAAMQLAAKRRESMQQATSYNSVWLLAARGHAASEKRQGR